MKTTKFSTMGALHPFLFFAVIYMVALLFSIFICSSLFYSCNTRSAAMLKEQPTQVEKQQPGLPAIAAVVKR